VGTGRGWPGSFSLKSEKNADPGFIKTRTRPGDDAIIKRSPAQRPVDRSIVSRNALPSFHGFSFGRLGSTPRALPRRLRP
jgi:hypothetical protein